MTTTQSAYDWLREKTGRAKARSGAAPGPPLSPEIGPRHEQSARAEIERLREVIHDLVTLPGQVRARAAVHSALDAVTRLQVVGANLDACKPPMGDDLSRALVRFADQHLHGHADAIERGMTYTADNTMRRLRGE